MGAKEKIAKLKRDINQWNHEYYFLIARFEPRQ